LAAEVAVRRQLLQRRPRQRADAVDVAGLQLRLRPQLQRPAETHVA